MSRLSYKSGTVIGLALFSGAALAAPEQLVRTVIEWPIYAFVLFVVIVGLAVYFRQSRDKRGTPMDKVFTERAGVHSVGPDTPVTECVRRMAAENIGALIIMDGEKLLGIFTERDALNKVLAGGLDPIHTKVSEVMTKDPICIAPTTTVGAAMELVTRRRIRHLPVLENGKVRAVVSSGDLTHWMVKEELGDVKDYVELAART